MNRYAVVFFLLLGISLPAFNQEHDTVYTIQNADSANVAAPDTIVSAMPVPVDSTTAEPVDYELLDSIYRVSREELPANDSSELVQLSDTGVAEVKVPKSPTRAMMYALVLPGLGQAYNEKYYKIPIVWAALGTAGYFVWYNTGKYKQATLEYLEDPNGDERAVQGWRRYLEISYIATIFIYGLQILDAYVDANMYTWDVNENLSLGISPSLQPLLVPTSATGYSGGLTCSFKLKGR
jgi:hypothetical protein